MDNHIFRSAALGFNRQDVMEYIEKTQKEAEANAASLSRRLDEAMSSRFLTDTLPFILPGAVAGVLTVTGSCPAICM